MWQSLFWQTVYTASALRRQWQPAEQIQALQERRLRAIVRYAARHVPFYRQRFQAASIDPETIRDLQDLPRLPLTVKQDLQTNYPDGMIPPFVRPEHYQVVTTSGTSGLVAHIAHDDRARDYYKALAYRHLHEIGYRPWHRLAYLRHESHPRHVWERLGLARQCFISSLMPVADQIAHLIACRPQIISAYPSILIILARELPSHPQAKQLEPTAILCHSELLPPAWRQRITAAFGCPLFDDYSTLEFFQMAFECRQHHYHIHADNIVLEFLHDGQPVEPGQVGEIVATSLTNRAMPLIRYCTGDLGALSSQPCPCGRGLPTIKLLAGRKEDTLFAANGQQVSPLTVVATMHDFINHFNHIAQYQLRQQAPNRFQMRIVPESIADRPALTQAIRNCLRPILGQTSEIEVNFVESLPRGETGKAHIVFNEMLRSSGNDVTPFNKSHRP